MTVTNVGVFDHECRSVALEHGKTDCQWVGRTQMASMNLREAFLYNEYHNVQTNRQDNTMSRQHNLAL